ncbi:hypothetical protein [Cupriavidus sp. BIS7]|uniref:hypothetical protein n=1 Tax=Cupriavidus sp. BIS7 TaxID=1217718 RepID=UPI00031DB42D|nr:hypothetical protein [Cupriavidus sp. BIS7]
MKPASRQLMPFWCFYVHQGMITALIARGASAYFRQQGWSLATLSYLSLAMLPWVFKGLWAGWAERHALTLRGNRYLGSLALLQAAMALTLFATGWLTPGDAPLMVVIALLWLATLSATHDIYADGIVIGTTTTASRPAASIAQVGGSYIGILACPPLFLAVAQWGGWTVALSTLGVVSLLLLYPALRLCQPLPRSAASLMKAPAAAAMSPRARWRETWRSLWPGLCLAAVAFPSMRAMMAIEAPILIDLGMTMSEAGAALALYATGGSALGIVAGGWIARRVRLATGLQCLLAAHIAIPAAGCLGYPVLGLPGWITLITLSNVAAAAAFVFVYRLLMDQVRPARPAADYALFQSVDAAVAIVMSIGILQLIHHTGYRIALGLLAVLACASLLAARRLVQPLGQPPWLAPWLAP